jgi:O-antigen ligase
VTTFARGVAPAFARAAAAARAAAPVPRLPSATANLQGARAGGDFMLISGMIWVLIVLMIVPEGFDYSTLTSAEAPAAGRIASRLLWLGLLGFGLVVILWRASLAWSVARQLNIFLLAFVVLVAASVTWSIDPPVTARRLIRIFTILAAAMAFVLVGWHARRFQNVLRPIITAILLGSIAFGVGWPDLAIHPETSGFIAGAWHGLANHKNGLGGLACVALIFWFHAWLTRESGAWAALLGSAVAAACLMLSRSSTSLVVAGFTLLFLAMLLRSPPGLRRYMPWLVTLFIAALLAYSLALLQILPGLHTLLSPISALTGKDMTFTGRTDIWDIMKEHIRLNPYLGTGYGAYWTPPDEAADSFQFFVQLNFYPGSAHNGYLEILNDLGAVGLVVLFCYLATFVAQSLRLLPVDWSQASLYLALFLQQALVNLAETRWLSVFSVDFVIMTLATAALARALLEQRSHRQSVVAQRPSYRIAPTIGVIAR